MQRLAQFPVDADGFEPAGEWTWVDVIGADPTEVREIARRFGFDRMSTLEVLHPTRAAEASDHGTYTLAIAHLLAEDADRLRTVELDIFVGTDFLVTFHAEGLAAVDWVWDQTALPEWRQGAGPDRIMARILEVATLRYRDIADALEQQIEVLESDAITGDPRVVVDVASLRGDAMRLRHIVRTHRDLTGDLADDEYPSVGALARMRVARAARLSSRVAESLELVRSMLGAVLETHRSSVAERANEIMKVLTVFAAIVLPMTLVAGVYGMNFANIPELDWRWGYFGALGLMAVIGGSFWLYFSRRGFIGGPRLRPVTRVLGRGVATLVDLTTLPARAMAGLILPRDRDSGADADADPGDDRL